MVSSWVPPHNLSAFQPLWIRFWTTKYRTEGHDVYLKLEAQVRQQCVVKYVGMALFRTVPNELMSSPTKERSKSFIITHSLAVLIAIVCSMQCAVDSNTRLTALGYGEDQIPFQGNPCSAPLVQQSSLDGRNWTIRSLDLFIPVLWHQVRGPHQYSPSSSKFVIIIIENNLWCKLICTPTRLETLISITRRWPWPFSLRCTWIILHHF